MILSGNLQFGGSIFSATRDDCFLLSRCVCCQRSHEVHHSFSTQKCQLPNAENFPGRLETMEPVAETMKKPRLKKVVGDGDVWRLPS